MDVPPAAASLLEPHEAAFRSEVRAWCRERGRVGLADAVLRGSRRADPNLVSGARPAGLAEHGLAEVGRRIGHAGLVRLSPVGRVGLLALGSSRSRTWDRGPPPHRARLGPATILLSPRYRLRRRRLQPRLFRARGRERPRRVADPSSPRRGYLRHQRREVLDVRRPQCPLSPAAGPHRRIRQPSGA